MDLQTAADQIRSRLRFGDQDQIAAYHYLERVAEIERVLEGDGSDQHSQAVEDAIGESGWLELMRLSILEGRDNRAVSLPCGCGSLPSLREA